MTIRVYSSLDTGAPALSGSPYNRIKQILMATLVTGYGSKPAAGWTVAHEVEHGFSLGNGDGFISFANAIGYNNSYWVKILETVTGDSDGHATGLNERIQTQHYNLGYTGSYAHWYVVADEKTVIYYIGGGTTTADMLDASTGAFGSAHYFGRYLNGSGLGPTFCSLGGSLGASPWIPLLRATPNTAYGSMLRNPFTNLVVQGASPRYAVAFNGYRNRPGGAFPPASVLRMQQLTPVRAGIMCYGGGLSGSSSDSSMVFAGRLRGVIGEPVLSGVRLSNVMSFFDLPNTWERRVQPILLPNGKQWMPLYPSPQDDGYFVSLDPADWE